MYAEATTVSGQDPDTFLPKTYILLPYDVADPKVIIHELRHTKGKISFGENCAINSGINEALTQWDLGLKAYAKQQYILEKIYKQIPDLQRELEACYYARSSYKKDQTILKIYSKIFNKFRTDGLINFSFLETFSSQQVKNSRLFEKCLEVMMFFTENDDHDMEYLISQQSYLKFMLDWTDKSNDDTLLQSFFEKSYSLMLSLPIKYHQKNI